MKFFCKLVFFLTSFSICTLPIAASSSDFTSFGKPIIDAADAGNEYLVTQYLKNRVSPNVKGELNTTALMRASLRGHDETVRYLLEAGADVHAKDIGGATALHMAARAGHTKVLDLLLKFGASPDANDLEGYTPLKRAILSEDLAIVDSLIKYDADIDLPGPTGVSAIDLVEKSNNKRLKELLVKEVVPAEPLEPIPSDEVKIEPISSLEKEAMQPMKVEEVEVGEAIELPESSNLRNDKVAISEKGDMQSNLADRSTMEMAPVQSITKAPVQVRQMAMEVSGFKDEEEAIFMWYGISDKKIFSNKQAKIVYDNSSNKTEYKLRFDGYYNPKEVFESCKKVRSFRSDVLCYVIHNIY